MVFIGVESRDANIGALSRGNDGVATIKLTSSDARRINIDLSEMYAGPTREPIKMNCYQEQRTRRPQRCAGSESARKIELPGYAEPIIHPAKLFAETVIAERHQCFSRFGERAKEMIDFIFRLAIHK